MGLCSILFRSSDSSLMLGNHPGKASVAKRNALHFLRKSLVGLAWVSVLVQTGRPVMLWADWQGEGAERRQGTTGIMQNGEASLGICIYVPDYVHVLTCEGCGRILPFSEDSLQAKRDHTEVYCLLGGLHGGMSPPPSRKIGKLAGGPGIPKNKELAGRGFRVKRFRKALVEKPVEKRFANRIVSDLFVHWKSLVRLNELSWHDCLPKQRCLGLSHYRMPIRQPDTGFGTPQ